MTEILFYHLQGQKLESVLPALLEKSLHLRIAGSRAIDIEPDTLACFGRGLLTAALTGAHQRGGVQRRV